MAIPTTVSMEHPAAGANPHPSIKGQVGPRTRFRLKWAGLGITAAAVIALAIYASVNKSPTADKLRAGLETLKEQVVGPTAVRPNPATPPEAFHAPQPWNGLVKVNPKERDAIGFKIMPVLQQTKPIRLEIPGKTDYDQNTLNKIRPRFDTALVEKVHVSVGQAVKTGDPLYDLKSVELATAKTDLRIKYVQWDHDRKYLNAREPLVKEARITQKEWTDTQNDEKKSRLDYLNARELLGTYEITKEQIDQLLEGLGDDKLKVQAVANNLQDISKMTVLSKYDGIVVERDVVPGNFYDSKDVLLTISPMDKLWVWGDVFESDADKVHLDQKWDILFQFTNKAFEGKVESIANGVDPETRTVRIRASIPNPGKNLKARMLVRATLQIAPLPSDTVIPRNALVVLNGDYYAFVEVGTSGKDADLFERRKLTIEQEDYDFVIVKQGLKAGERVVSSGSLILAQMHEDQSTVDSGVPRP